MIEYINGNYNVKILNDGTKIREWEDGIVPTPLFPESIDVKITNYCDMGCVFCHEKSTTEGLHGDHYNLFNMLVTSLSPGVELAIGGGNPMSHPEFYTLITGLSQTGIICNLTMNQGHIKKHQEELEFLLNMQFIRGLGISIMSPKLEYVERLKEISNNIVYHVIAGVTPISTIDALFELPNPKLLILGYKEFGFGVDYLKDNESSIYKNMEELYRKLPEIVQQDGVVSFDNLAIEQLNVKRLFTTEGWKRFYMGDDFEYTMYIDAVEETFAPTSRSTDRVPWNDMSLIDYFQTNRIKR